MYLIINETIRHFECNSIECNSIKEKNGNKYLVLDDIDETKEVLNKYKEVWECIKKEIETINGGKKIEHGKDFLKIRFKSNDDLPLNKPIRLLFLDNNY